jgi:hypothetical protein
MAVARPNEIALVVCDALGIDPTNVLSVTIKLTAQDAPRVEVVRLPSPDDAVALGIVLKRYTLTESNHAG